MFVNKSWADLTFTIGNVPLIEIQGAEYSRERKKEDHYGPGAKVVSRGYGNVADKGLKLKMSFDELKRLEAAAPLGDITLYPPGVFQAIWKPNTQAAGQVDTLTNVEFISNGRDLKQGDTKHFAMIDCIFAGFNDPQ